MNDDYRKKLLAKIHIVKKELKLSDEIYRDIIYRECKKSSASKLDLAQLEHMVRVFVIMTKSNKHSYRKTASKAQVRKVYALYGELKKLGATKLEKPDALIGAILYGKGSKVVVKPENLKPNELSKIINAFTVKVQQVS